MVAACGLRWSGQARVVFTSVALACLLQVATKWDTEMEDSHSQSV